MHVLLLLINYMLITITISIQTDIVYLFSVSLIKALNDWRIHVIKQNKLLQQQEAIIRTMYNIKSILKMIDNRNN